MVSKLCWIRMACLTAGLSFLGSVAQAQDALDVAGTSARPSVEPNTVQFGNDRLTVKVRDVPLRGLLQEIARQSGLDVVIHGSLEESVSMKFDRLFFNQGLRRILRRHSFVIEYGQGTPKALWILADGKRVPSHKTVAHTGIEWTSSRYIETEIPAEPTSHGEEKSSIEILTNVDSEEVIQDLAIALQDEDPSLKAEVLAVIDKLGDIAAIETLELSLLDGSARAQGTGLPADN